MQTKIQTNEIVAKFPEGNMLIFMPLRIEIKSGDYACLAGAWVQTRKINGK